MSIAIKDAKIPGRSGRFDILLDGGKIDRISGKEDGDEVIQADGKYLLPGFVNTHTHAAMSLFRGYADDMPLQQWLEDHIWPLESKLTKEDVYWGTKLACLEMIKTGTVAFNDMYFFMESAADAVEEMGMKAVLSYGFIDLGDEEKRKAEIKKTKKFVDYVASSELIKPALGPHAIYTVSEEGLRWCAEFSHKRELPVHLHLAETEDEIKEFKRQNTGYDHITEYLDEVGLLSNNLLAAHCVWLDEEDIVNLSDKGVVVSHNPVSNMKLGVGKPMDYGSMYSAGVRVTLGTDGCASNNNLDMLETAKIAALQQKISGDPTLLSAEDGYSMITEIGARALKTGGGSITEGMAADIILLDKGIKGVPGHNPVSDLIYSLQGSDVTHVFINGSMVMKDRYVRDEDEIVREATARAMNLVKGV